MIICVAFPAFEFAHAAIGTRQIEMVTTIETSFWPPIPLFPFFQTPLERNTKFVQYTKCNWRMNALYIGKELIKKPYQSFTVGPTVARQSIVHTQH